MKIVFLGTPEFSVPILTALANNYEIALVVSQPNRVKKKGIFLDTPVAAKAKELNLKLLQPVKISNIFAEIESVNADLLVSAAFGQYVPTKILQLFKKTINVHGSLLPQYRGGAPIQRAIMNGDNKTGITLIEMAKQLDAGIMYAKREVPITNETTSFELFATLSIVGRDLLMEKIEDIYMGRLLGEAQDEALVSYAPNLDASEEIIDFKRPAIQVVRQINGLSKDPGATIIFKGMNIKVYKASIMKNSSAFEPGTILSLKKSFIVKTLDDAVSLDVLLIPGKKMMDVKSFVNGQKIFKEFDVI